MKAVFIVFNHELSHVSSAVKSIYNRHQFTIEIHASTPESFTDSGKLNEFLQSAEGADIALMHLMGGRACLAGFDQIISTFGECKIPVFAASVPYDEEFITTSTVDKNTYDTIHGYIKCGEAENFENLLLFLTNHFTGSAFAVNPPKSFPLEDIYHPQTGYIPTLDEYIEKRYSPDKPTVGVLCGHNPLKSGNSGYLDSLVESIERHGANALVVFLSATDSAVKSLTWVVSNYFMKNGKARVDVVVSTQGHSLAAYMQGSGSSVDDLFQELGVPVLKAIATYNTFEVWRDSLQGLSFSEVSWNVAMPEFDGLLITVPIAAKCVSETDPITHTKIVSHQVIPERLDKLVIVVCPQCPNDARWSGLQLELLNALLDEVVSEHRIDEQRIYLTGLSMGGFGTWRLAMAYPDRFAAIAPVCGGGDPDQAPEVAHLPTWVFHGAKDNVVSIENSKRMIDALKKAGGNVKITIYPDAGHDSWTETYNNPKLYDWFLSHSIMKGGRKSL